MAPVAARMGLPVKNSKKTKTLEGILAERRAAWNGQWDTNLVTRTARECASRHVEDAWTIGPVEPPSWAIGALVSAFQAAGLGVPTVGEWLTFDREFASAYSGPGSES